MVVGKRLKVTLFCWWSDVFFDGKQNQLFESCWSTARLIFDSFRLIIRYYINVKIFLLNMKNNMHIDKQVRGRVALKYLV